jgi:hypothetical protein
VLNEFYTPKSDRKPLPGYDDWDDEPAIGADAMRIMQTPPTLTPPVQTQQPWTDFNINMFGFSAGPGQMR